MFAILYILLAVPLLMCLICELTLITGTCAHKKQHLEESVPSVVWALNKHLETQFHE